MSIGFWVATIMKGSGSGCTTPSTVTVASSASSSSADWVRGVARFSSSNTTMLANTGPGRNVMLSTSSRPLGTIEPVMSPGRRSEVPWIRWKVPPIAACEHLGEQGLADAGDVLDQQVAAARAAWRRPLRRRRACRRSPRRSFATSRAPRSATAADCPLDRPASIADGPERRSGDVGRGHGRRRQRVHEGASAPIQPRS